MFLLFERNIFLYCMLLSNLLVSDLFSFPQFLSLTQSAEAVEYTDCISKCPGYDTKQSDGEAPILELWGMWSTPSLSLFPSPL